MTRFVGRMPKVDVGPACIDTENYRIFAGFREPSRVIRGFSFNEKEAPLTSGWFPKDFSGVGYLGEVFEGRGPIIALGTMGGTIHLWDCDS